MVNFTQLQARAALLAGGAALVAMVTMTACSGDKNDAPTDVKEPSGTSAPQSPATLTPTEKQSIGSFSPDHSANPAPTRVPGAQGRLSP
ncbi:MAG: hypothetical protein KDB50_04725 [Mycobacterium sp.]|nr:hypothetical protein [Mycobacterium sp.]